MMENKYSLQEVADKVQWEGLGDTIENYFSENTIEDKTLAKLWKQAKEILDKIDEILEPYYLEPYYEE